MRDEIEWKDQKVIKVGKLNINEFCRAQVLVRNQIFSL